MKLRKTFLGYLLLILAIFTFLTGFEVKKLPNLIIPGTIEGVDKDSKFIQMKGKKFSLSPETKIVDEKGTALGTKDLKPKLPVTIEAAGDTEGASVSKIVIQAPRK